MNRAFSAGVCLCTNSWGAAPGYDEYRAFGAKSIFVVARLYSRGGRAPRLQQIELRRTLGRPRIAPEFCRHNFVAITPQQVAKAHQIKRAEFIRQTFEIPQRQIEQACGRAQTPAVLGVRWMIKILLQM